MKTSQQIRQDFIDYFLKQDHKFVPSSSVVPLDDPTLLFTNAGMNQFKDIFLGSKTPDHPRAVNSQKCIRVSGKHNDLEEVGKDTYHHTFFEMLGNWSFGDYFKAEAICWAWQLFTKVWGFNPNQLWATVFAGDANDNLPPDEEAEKLWIENSELPPERVLRFSRKDNFWEMGDVGPCGPCSEIHIDLGPDRCDKQDDPDHTCGVNGDCSRFIELWNLVFIQYNRDETGKLSELPAKHVDTGAGLERIVAVLQNKTSNYDTDLFMPLIDHIAQITGKKYTSQLGNQTDNAFRVISDHIRTLSFAICDGALPSNDGRGYVLRRILRRAARFGLLLDMHEPFLYQLVPTLVDYMGTAFPELKTRAHHVINVIKAEETGFSRTLERGIAIFESDIAELEQQNLKTLPGDKAFRLYDTYGFPLDLTQLMAEERNLTVDVDGFTVLMQQQKDQARAAQKNLIYEADALSEVLPATSDSQKYLTSSITARLLGYVMDNHYHTRGSVPAFTRVGLVLDRTCAYAEAGGQVGDKGIISADNLLFNFDDTRRIGPAVVHFGSTDSENISIGMEMTLTIDPARDDTRRNHTATHLLQWALQKVLGSHAHQEGSMVCADYLRFDFTHPESLTHEQILQVEKLVRDQIAAAHPVTFKVMPIDDARKLGAMALFSEKYGETVRVLAIGTESPDALEEAFSREFCGGTHVNNTSDIGSFKIIKEESVATGIRRITAMTGRALNDMLYQRSDLIDQLGSLLKTTPDEVVERIKNLIDTNKKLNKQLKKGTAGDLKSSAQQLLDNAAAIGSAKIIIGETGTAPVEAIRSQIDWLRKKAPSAAIVLAAKTEDHKVLLFAAVTDDLIKQGLKAGDIVKQIAPLVGGGGGGRPQMAQAGGKNPEKINDALEAARILIKNSLSKHTI
ncbi:MAG: alanine--tRNA ligase [Sedimentisphaerales bacterium]|nr:alanine--tRNA ligase [Sedimentisphaerales bacterium]